MDYNNIFGFKTFGGYMTSRQLKRHSEWTTEYKGYTIAFGKCQKDADGRYWWSVRVWKNEGTDRLGAFTMNSLCATDSEAESMEIRWAKANIDRIA